MHTANEPCACGQREWLLKRNCSLTPRQLGLSYLVLCGASFAVASIWLVRGAWVVLAFSMLEMTAAAIAWLVYARHATDHECVTLTNAWLKVDQVEAGRSHTVRLDPRQTRIIAPAFYGELVRLEAPGVKVEVGRHVWPGRRRQLADELRAGLRTAF
jgi:uncharacterized membrane protein